MGKREAAGNLDFGSAETKERERALEPAIPLGLPNHRSFRRSVWQWPRKEYPNGIG